MPTITPADTSLGYSFGTAAKVVGTAFEEAPEISALRRRSGRRSGGARSGGRRRNGGETAVFDL